MSAPTSPATPDKLSGSDETEKSLIGELVIINEFDKPCTRLIAQVDRVENGLAYAHYITEGTQMRNCWGDVRKVTPIYKFGVMYEVKGGYISAAAISASKATYLDGKPRHWQPAGEESRCKLRKVKGSKRPAPSPDSLKERV